MNNPANPANQTLNQTTRDTEIRENEAVTAVDESKEKEGFDSKKAVRNDVKTTFDTFRNIGICAVVIFAGAKLLFMQPPKFLVTSECFSSLGGVVNPTLGVLTLVMGLLLVMANLMWCRRSLEHPIAKKLSMFIYPVTLLAFGAYAINYLGF
ncbi:hypothetical protein [Vibrio parahaemolyticus]|uniref:hypothetical protein n=1 Tax=Vibrio parahaemolyticus TaxID=670 RepID=UPI00215CE7B7|nr:hypothetical protein [Vibrio parahaemolyticus]EIY8174321.1 hypothetical protein [Vibrio parahaemolyticus]EIY8252255.1 hypothetical protein [Vibrio parahaemolyticus]MCR9371698.1 hypothetical protein [Vibrio parahaemolyticus]